MKPSIDEQIVAVERAISFSIKDSRDRSELEAAAKTLHWVKRHAPTIKSVLGEFEGSTVKPREEE